MRVVARHGEEAVHLKFTVCSVREDAKNAVFESKMPFCYDRREVNDGGQGRERQERGN